MSMNKANRKEAYVNILNLMVKEKHKEAYDAFRKMMGEDCNIFVLATYEDCTGKESNND